jgi:hypothetical protein
MLLAIPCDVGLSDEFALVGQLVSGIKLLVDIDLPFRAHHCNHAANIYAQFHSIIKSSRMFAVGNSNNILSPPLPSQIIINTEPFKCCKS